MRNIERAWFFFFLPLSLVLAFGCGDDGGGGPDAAADTGTVDTSTGDTGTTDTGAADTGAADTGGMITCFDLSIPAMSGTPDALDVTLGTASSMWMRPTGEVCPATGLGAEMVPYEAICYVNDTANPITFTFEVLNSGDPAPAAVIYDGMTLPTDHTQCAAISSDLVIDVAEATHTVAAGEMVTLVATFQEAGTDDIQMVVTPE